MRIVTELINRGTAPRVSIIFSVKNEEKTIGEALTSALNLDYPNYEVIMVDGGSEDQTISIAQRISASQKRMKIIQNRDSTAGQGRNLGIEYTSGEIIAFFDGDCYVRKNWLKKGVNLLMKDGVGGVGGAKISATRSSYLSKVILDILSTPFARGNTTIFSRYNETKEVRNIGGVTLYKKKALQKAGLYTTDLKYCEDVDLNYRIRKVGYKLLYSPRLEAEHDWKVQSFWSLFKYMLGYGYGRSVACRKYRHLFSIQYTVPTITFLIAVFTLLLSIMYNGAFNTMIQFLVFSYGFFTLTSALHAAYKFRDARVIVVASLTYILTHIGYGLGFAFGLIKGNIK